MGIISKPRKLDWISSRIKNTTIHKVIVEFLGGRKYVHRAVMCWWEESHFVVMNANRQLYRYPVLKIVSIDGLLSESDFFGILHRKDYKDKFLIPNIEDAPDPKSWKIASDVNADINRVHYFGEICQ